jgi:hypothetical protein
VFRAVQAFDAFDDDGIGAMAADLRAHRIEAVRDVDDFRLTRGVFDDRTALRQHRRHHDVLGTADRDDIEHDVAAAQPATAVGMDIAALDDDFGAQRLEPAQVQVHRPAADGAATGKRHVRLTEMRDQRP